MKLKLSLILLALSLCVINVNAKNPFASLAKIKGVQCLKYDALPSQGIALERGDVNIDIGMNDNLVAKADPRDIVILITDQAEAAARIQAKAEKVCKSKKYETLANIGEGDQHVNISYLSQPDGRTSVAIIIKSEKEALLLSANLKCSAEELLQMLQED